VLPAPPLYDGVIVVEPYLWRDPPPDELGGAQGVNATIAVADGVNDPLAVATAESPPQVQLIGSTGSLRLRPTSTSIKVSVTPVPSRPAPPGSYIDGNSYRINVTDQAANPITAPASNFVTLILRPADPGLTEATIERFDGAQWRPLRTDSAGAAGFFAIVTQFGEFAVIARGASPYPTTPHVVATAAPSTVEAPETVGPAPSGSQSPAPPPETHAFDAPEAVLFAIAFAAAVLIGLAVRRARRHRDPVRDGWRR
jgi:hypothetical protein